MTAFHYSHTRDRDIHGARSPHVAYPGTARLLTVADAVALAYGKGWYRYACARGKDIDRKNGLETI